MGDFQTLTGYLRACLRRRGAEAWTPKVRRAVARHVNAPISPSGSANRMPLAAAAKWCHSRTGPLSSWCATQFRRDGGHGFGDHELLGAYWIAVLGALKTVVHVDRRRGKEPPPGVEAVLEAAHVLMALLSTHPGTGPPRVVAPMLRTGNGPGRSDLAIPERDYVALASRHELGLRARPPNSIGGTRCRFRAEAAWLSSWVNPRAAACRAFIAGPTPETARPLVDLLQGMGVRLRPTPGRSAIISARSGSDVACRLDSWPGWGPTRGSVPAMVRQGPRIYALSPYPVGWSFGGGGTAGRLTSRMVGGQLLVEVVGAKRLAAWLPQTWRAAGPATPGEWRVVIDAGGVRL